MTLSISQLDLPLVAADAALVPLNAHEVFDAGESYLAKRVIPITIPVRHGMQGNALAQAYRNAFDQVVALDCRTVAVPLVGSEFGISLDASLSVASDVLRGYCETHDVDVTLCLYGDDKEGLRKTDLFRRVSGYMDSMAYEDAFAIPQFSMPMAAPAFEERQACEYSSQPAAEPLLSAEPQAAPAPQPHKRRFGLKLPSPGKQKRGRVEASFEGVSADAPLSSPSCSYSLEDMLSNLDASFADTLFKLIDASGMTDAEVYRRAGMSRQLFSKIRSNPDYRPKKPTVVSLCIALRLTLPETSDLLSRAGYSLSHASKFDIIIEYFIREGIYDLVKINAMLYAYDLELLGCA